MFIYYLSISTFHNTCESKLYCACFINLLYNQICMSRNDSSIQQSNNHLKRARAKANLPGAFQINDFAKKKLLIIMNCSMAKVGSHVSPCAFVVSTAASQHYSFQVCLNNNGRTGPWLRLLTRQYNTL